MNLDSVNGSTSVSKTEGRSSNLCRDAILRHDYLLAEVTWATGFKHKMGLRGFNLKSWIEFHKSLSQVTNFEWWVVTEKEYEDYLYGEPDEPRTRETKTLNKKAQNRKPRSKASKDSEGVRTSDRPAPSPRKNARTKLREPKVRDVLKPKKNLGRTNDSGKKTSTRNGTNRTKRST